MKSGRSPMRGKLFAAKHAIGFTLVELMITVVILAILAAIAYPSYTNHVTRTRRSDAQVALLQIANQQERFFTECNRYASSVTAARTCAALGLGFPNDRSPDSHYQLSVSAGNTNGSCTAGSAAYTCGYTAVANPNGTGVSGRQNNNGKLRIDALGNKSWDKNNSDTWCCSWTTK